MKKTIAIILLIVWMMVIFNFSSQNATNSSGQSMGIIKVLGLDNNKNIEFIIRKSAHMFSYFVLFLSAINVFKQFNNIVGRKEYIYSVIICLIYAITDELHQTFVPGRTGKYEDVLIDMIGVIVGIFVTMIVKKFKINKKV